MIQRYLAIILILCPIASYGQFGGNVRYLFGQSETLDSFNLNQDGIYVSLEYSFRLKEKRLEFHPGLGYRMTFNKDDYDGYMTSIDFDFNTAIYPFDFSGDCDCPTWSKDGSMFKKGFFFEVSPGIAYQTLHRTKRLASDIIPMVLERVDLSSSNIIWKVGAAIGLDIGLSDQFTLTPMFSWTLQGPAEWDHLDRKGSSGTLDDYSYLGAGFRLAYKPDPKRRRRF